MQYVVEGVELEVVEHGIVETVLKHCLVDFLREYREDLSYKFNDPGPHYPEWL
jgi:hypothetical protein